MSTESIIQAGDELLANPEAPSLGGVLLMPGFLYSQLQAAQRIGKQATRLYAMSDAELSSRGISRQDIRVRLREGFGD